MPHQPPLDKLKAHLTEGATSAADSTGAPERQPGQETETNGTRTVDWPLFLKLHEEIKNGTVETLTNLTAHSSRVEGELARTVETLTEFVAVVKDGNDEGRTHYTTREFAEKLMKAGIKKFKGGVEGGARQVRKWCREKRIRAEHRRSGRGKHGEWMIPHAEFVRYKNEGLLPPPKD
jgi:hypothetical protein